MKSFSIKRLSRWHEMDGSPLEMAAAGRREVKLTVNAVGLCAVYAADNPDFEGETLVGAAEGMFDLSYIVDGVSYVRFDAEGRHFVAAVELDQRVPKTIDAPKYTTVMPRNRRNSEVDQMMQMMKLNALRFDQKIEEQAKRHAAEMKAIKAAQTAKKDNADDVVEPDQGAEGAGE